MGGSFVHQLLAAAMLGLGLPGFAILFAAERRLYKALREAKHGGRS